MRLRRRRSGEVTATAAEHYVKGLYEGGIELVRCALGENTIVDGIAPMPDLTEEQEKWLRDVLARATEHAP